MSSRWYAATIQKHQDQPYGQIHAAEVGSRAAACGVESFPWFYWFAQPLDGLRVTPDALCRECSRVLVAAAATRANRATNERG